MALDPRCVLLEDTWEADDVKEECLRLNIECKELTVEELINLETTYFLANVYLCNSKIIQQHLEKAGLKHLVVDTYTEQFGHLFKRRIEKKRLGDIKHSDLPLFIKPVSNDKHFDGQVVHVSEDLNSIIKELDGDAHDMIVYTSEVVEFGFEVRLFIGNGKLYDHGIREEGKLKKKLRKKLLDSKEFHLIVTDIVEKSGGEFYAVDIGPFFHTSSLVKEEDKEVKGDERDVETSSYEWAIVEVNPCFALDDCNISIENYMKYIIDAHAFLVSKYK